MQGLLLIDKPAGMTSFAVVARIKRLCNTKRVGHTGTLDPMATGVLPVFVGRPTVLSSYLLEADKTYRVTVQLGLTTDTYDSTGTVTAQTGRTVERNVLCRVLEEFVGEQLQLPPMFSALKKDGVRLYDLARQGIEVERKARRICIHDIRLLNFSGHVFQMEVCCTKGTYIRSLVHDIGQKLQTGAVMTDLRRLKTGSFSIENCTPLAQLEQGPVESFLLPAELAVMHYPAVSVSYKQAVRFSNGGELSVNRLRGPVPAGATVRVRYGEHFLGLGFVNPEKEAITVICGVEFMKMEEPLHE